MGFALQRRTEFIISMIFERIGNMKYDESIKDVDSYLSAAPKEVQDKLREVRAAIRQVAPSARESISYGMAYYDYKGRLAWFGFHKEYISLYLRPPIVEQHNKELAGYETTKSAIHLPLDKKLPTSLIKQLVKARMRINEAEESGANSKKTPTAAIKKTKTRTLQLPC
jgi:uncharacterized protein YdhG (YjbR/CyaY superfamily)